LFLINVSISSRFNFGIMVLFLGDGFGELVVIEVSVPRLIRLLCYFGMSIVMPNWARCDSILFFYPIARSSDFTGNLIGGMCGTILNLDYY